MAKITNNTFVSPADVAAVMAEGLDYGASLASVVWSDNKLGETVDVNDAVNIYVPSLMTASRRGLRDSADIAVNYVNNNKIQVRLTDHYYQAVPVTDAEMTLDIQSFSDAIVAPIASSLSRTIEQLIATKISTTPHKTTISTSDMTLLPFSQAASKLTAFGVPLDGRVLVIGTGVQSLMLPNNAFSFLMTGSSDAHRKGIIGELYGATVIVSPYVPTNKAYLFHRSAFPLVARAPKVTESTGAEWAYGTGATVKTKNVAISVVRDRDAMRLRDIVSGSVFVGVSAVTDKGKVTKTGVATKFVPWTTDQDPASTADDCFIRGVELVFTSIQV